MTTSRFHPRRNPVGIAAIAVALVALGALTATAAVGQSASDAIPGGVDAAALDQFGEFEVLDASALGAERAINSVDALVVARKEQYGRAGVPQASLLRVTNTDLGLIPLEKGRLVLIYRWTGLGEEYPKEFPEVEKGVPNATVFVLNDYFLLVDAETGEVIASVQH